MNQDVKAKSIALDWRRQKRQQDYLRLPHNKLVEQLCDVRYTIMRRNQQIKTLEAVFRRYGQHLSYCASTRDWMVADCNCGFTTALHPLKEHD